MLSSEFKTGRLRKLSEETVKVSRAELQEIREQLEKALKTLRGEKTE